MQEYDLDGDGVVDRTDTSIIGVENRVPDLVVETVADGVVYERTRSWDAVGCIDDEVEVFHGVSSRQVESYVQTCDEHGDRLTYEWTSEEEEPNSPFFGVNAHQVIQLEPTYPSGDSSNGRRETEYVQEWTDVSFDAAVDPAVDGPTAIADVVYTYDAEDRVTEIVTTGAQGQGDTATFRRHEDHPTLVESVVVVRSVPGQLDTPVSRQEWTFDEFDRITENLVQSGDGAVEVTTSVWEPERHALTSQVYFQDDVELARGTVSCDEENPWVTCVFENDLADADGVFDGVPDWTLETTYTCP